MLRPEIPTLPPPAYLLDGTEDQPAEDWRSEDWHTHERPSAA
jgi:hypothetical protein